LFALQLFQAIGSRAVGILFELFSNGSIQKVFLKIGKLPGRFARVFGQVAGPV
jgi:hypothetical protein